MSVGSGNGTALAGLRRLVHPRDEPDERCELCDAPLPPDPHHEHLLEVEPRTLRCACTACAMLFPADADKRYRRVPQRLLLLDGFVLDDARWESLAIPVNMAFFLRSAPVGTVHAHYPGPAGATESLLTLSGWAEMVADNPVLEEMVPDVEALLVHRVGPVRDHFIAPIDRCYALVGLIRLHWRGLSGGEDVWARIDEFFATLRSLATRRGRDA